LDLNLGITGPAQSNDIYHFTGRVGDRPNDVPEHIRIMTPQQRLDAILSEGVLRAFPPFGVDFPCACFSKSTSEHLAFLVKNWKVKPWGIVTGQGSVFRLGGGAVAYVPDDQYEKFKRLGRWAVRVGANSTWMHEREWRIPRKSGVIRLEGLRAVLLGDASWRPSRVETEEWINPETGEPCQGPGEAPNARPREDYPALWRESAIWVWDDKSDTVIKYPPGALR
jgi:hypothetical protein